jgi:hypothetical protein
MEGHWLLDRMDAEGYQVVHGTPLTTDETTPTRRRYRSPLR